MIATEKEGTTQQSRNEEMCHLHHFCSWSESGYKGVGIILHALQVTFLDFAAMVPVNSSSIVQ